MRRSFGLTAVSSGCALNLRDRVQCRMTGDRVLHTTVSTHFPYSDSKGKKGERVYRLLTVCNSRLFVKAFALTHTKADDSCPIYWTPPSVFGQKLSARSDGDERGILEGCPVGKFRCLPCGVSGSTSLWPSDARREGDVEMDVWCVLYSLMDSNGFRFAAILQPRKETWVWINGKGARLGGTLAV